MQRQIDSKTIYVESTPMMPMMEDKPEPPRVADRELDREQIKKKFRWSDDDWKLAQTLDTARNTAFPSAVKGDTWGRPIKWSEKALDKWAGHMREKGQTMLRLVG